MPRPCPRTFLEAIARALELDDAEYAHLLDLARTARDGARPVRRRPPAKQMRPSLQHMRDAMTGAAPRVSRTDASTSSPPTR
ncbi:MAG: hypothetical protein M3P83_00685 [Actinomycetota bacterium]|nr:hypothetical protein [Actinomycetota bacterium]